MNTYNYRESLKLVGTLCLKATTPVLEWIPKYWLRSSKYGAVFGMATSLGAIGYYFYKYGPAFIMRVPLFNTGLEVQYDIISFPLVNTLAFACMGPQIIPMSLYIGAKYMIYKWLNISAYTNNISPATSALPNIVDTQTNIGSQVSPNYIHIQEIRDKRDIPSIDFVEDRPDTCFICCDSLEQIDNALSCGHYMHRYCFLKSKKTSCPKCRQEVKLTKDEYYLLATNSIV